MGFHKILKKHDKRLPNPCRSFYIARLHEQSWIRGDYSDIIVSMSRVYSKLRGDEVLEEKDNAKQVSKPFYLFVFFFYYSCVSFPSFCTFLLLFVIILFLTSLS
jgi:hypothetical protein